jgi:hypothetical protein
MPSKSNTKIYTLKFNPTHSKRMLLFKGCETSSNITMAEENSG